MAKKEAEGEKLKVGTVKQELAFLVLQIYLDIHTFEAKVKTSEQAVNEAREHLRLAVVRNGAGVGLKSDELRAKTHHLAEAEQQAVTAENNLRLAKLRLSLAIGLTENDNIETGNPQDWLVQPNSDALKSRAGEKKRSGPGPARPAKKRTECKLARSDYLPSLVGFASYQTNARDIPFGADNDSWLAGIGLK